MKRILLAAAAMMLTTGIATMKAQEFTAKDWVKNQQTFNNDKTFTYGDDNKSLTVEFGEGENGGLRRAEIANKVPVTLGGENTVVVFKVTYENATFINFDKNMIYVRRQMRTTSDAATEATAVAPYFITNQNSNAGRISENGKQDCPVAYYWRYLPGLTNENVTPTIAPDWSNEFVVCGSFANNTKYTFDGADTWGYSYLGIRLNHSKDATEEKDNMGTLGNDVKATFNYIEITTPDKLGEGFATADNGNQGKMVKAYIEAQLKGTETGINIIDNANVVVRAFGNTIAAEGASKVEVYNLAGAKIAASNGENVTVAPGLYIVKADNVVRKVMVK